MAFMYGYMTPSELEIAQENTGFELELLRIDHAFSRAVMEHELRLKDIDLHVLTERYTESDLEDEYTKECAVYTEGVKEIWDSFVQWVTKIVNTILGKNKEVTNTTIPEESKGKKFTIPFNVKAIIEFLKELPSKVVEFVKNNATKVAAASASALTVVLAGATIYLKRDKIKDGIDKVMEKVKKPTEITVENIPETISLIDSGLDAVNKAVASVKEISKEAYDVVKEFISPALTLASNCCAKLREILSNIGKAVGDVAGKAKDGVVNATNGVKDKLPKKDKKAAVSEPVKESTFEDLLNDMLAESTSLTTELDDFLESCTDTDIDTFDDLLDLI